MLFAFCFWQHYEEYMCKKLPKFAKKLYNEIQTCKMNNERRADSSVKLYVVILKKLTTLWQPCNNNNFMYVN